jgi:hypothetical protein
MPYGIKIAKVKQCTKLPHVQYNFSDAEYSLLKCNSIKGYLFSLKGEYFDVIALF